MESITFKATDVAGNENTKVAYYNGYGWGSGLSPTVMWIIVGAVILVVLVSAGVGGWCCYRNRCCYKGVPQDP